MSYSYGMFFKKVTSKEQAFDVITSFLEHMKEKEVMKNHMEKAIFNCPILHMKDRHNYGVSNLISKNWLKSIYNFNFIYWEEKQLLGLSGYTYDTDIFDCHISFQNSCDPNEPYDTWYPLGNWAIDLSNQIQKMTVEEYISKIDCSITENIEDDGDNFDIDYHKQVYLHTEIQNILDLQDWLWGKTTSKFKRITVCAIDCVEQEYELIELMNQLIKQIEKE